VTSPAPRWLTPIREISGIDLLPRRASRIDRSIRSSLADGTVLGPSSVTSRRGASERGRRRGRKGRRRRWRLEEENGVGVGRGRVGGAVLNTGVIAESSERVQRHSMSAWSYCMTHSRHRQPARIPLSP
jgi:hypothetical protein